MSAPQLLRLNRDSHKDVFVFPLPQASFASTREKHAELTCLIPGNSELSDTSSAYRA